MPPLCHWLQRCTQKHHANEFTFIFWQEEKLSPRGYTAAKLLNIRLVILHLLSWSPSLQPSVLLSPVFISLPVTALSAALPPSVRSWKTNDIYYSSNSSKLNSREWWHLFKSEVVPPIDIFRTGQHCTKWYTSLGVCCDTRCLDAVIRGRY